MVVEVEVVVEAVVVHQHVELTILLRESLRFFAPFSLLLNELITVELPVGRGGGGGGSGGGGGGGAPCGGVLCAGNKDTHFRTNSFSMFHVTLCLI